MKSNNATQSAIATAVDLREVIDLPADGDLLSSYGTEPIPEILEHQEIEDQ